MNLGLRANSPNRVGRSHLQVASTQVGHVPTPQMVADFPYDGNRSGFPVRLSGGVLRRFSRAIIAGRNFRPWGLKDCVSLRLPEICAQQNCVDSARLFPTRYCEPHACMVPNRRTLTVRTLARSYFRLKPTQQTSAKQLKVERSPGVGSLLSLY